MGSEIVILSVVAAVMIVAAIVFFFYIKNGGRLFGKKADDTESRAGFNPNCKWKYSGDKNLVKFISWFIKSQPNPTAPSAQDVTLNVVEPPLGHRTITVNPEEDIVITPRDLWSAATDGVVTVHCKVGLNGEVADNFDHNIINFEPSYKAKLEKEIGFETDRRFQKLRELAESTTFKSDKKKESGDAYDAAREYL